MINAQSFYETGNLDSAMTICNKALVYAENKNYTDGKAESYYKMADIAYQQSDLPSMAHYDSLALQAAQSISNKILEASCLNLLGLYFAENGNKEVAESIFFNAVKIAATDETLTADIYNGLGYMYGLQGEPDKSVDWHLKSLSLYEKLNNQQGEAKVLDNVATLYYNLSKFEQAITYQKRCISIRTNSSDHYGLAVAYSNISQMYLAIDSINEAFHYQELGMTNAASSGSKRLQAQAYIARALLYNKEGNDIKALNDELKAISILEETGDNEMLSRRYIAAAVESSRLKDSITALNYFNKAISLSTQLHNRENLRDAYYYRTVFFKERKDYFNAYENYKKYISIRDSIVNDETLTKISEIQTHYETEKKDAQIKKLTDEQLIQQLQLEKQKAIIQGNLLAAKEKENEIDLLTKTHALQNLEIKKEEQDLQTQTILAKITEQKRQLAEQDRQLKDKQLQKEKLLRNIIIAAFIVIGFIVFGLFNRYQLKKKLEQQQMMLKERNRISSELHDEVGSTLSAINIFSHSAKNNLEKNVGKSGEFISKISDSSQRMMLAMKDIVWSINPGNDSMESMIIRMKEYGAEILESKSIDYRFYMNDVDTTQYINEQLRRDIYLVFKEGLNNLVKYADASFAEIKLESDKKNIHLVIIDNGKGFNISKSSSGNGLKNIKQRTEAHNGSFTIAKNENKGTCIHAIFSIA